MRSPWERRSSVQRSVENVEGLVLATKSSRASMKRSGSSSWGRWPASLKISNLQPTAWHGLLGGVPVVDRQYSVVFAPNDQRRHMLREVETVACVYELPTRPDDPAQGTEERRARLGIGERSEGARVELSVIRWTQAQSATGARREIDQ